MLHICFFVASAEQLCLFDTRAAEYDIIGPIVIILTNMSAAVVKVGASLLNSYTPV